jgi:hypothetical protein
MAATLAAGTAVAGGLVGFPSAALRPLWLVLVVALLCGAFLSPDEASKEFYSAIAGVIPVLLLTPAVEARFFELPSPGRAILWLGSRLDQAIAGGRVQTESMWGSVERIFFGVALLALRVVGEFAALHPLATGLPTDGNPRLGKCSRRCRIHGRWSSPDRRN